MFGRLLESLIRVVRWLHRAGLGVVLDGQLGDLIRWIIRVDCDSVWRLSLICERFGCRRIRTECITVGTNGDRDEQLR